MNRQFVCSAAFFGIAAFFCNAANAQAAPADDPALGANPSPSPSPTPDLSEIERAVRADQEAQKKNQPPAAAAPMPAPVQPGGSGWASVGRFFQSLNPDLSVILDLAAGYYSNENVLKSGDDPGHTGFNVQELEIALQAVVDPYFRADVFLTIPNLGGLEVEEAFVTTTHLPGNFQLKAGIFRAGFGRQNTQHLHVQDFTRRPEINAAFLGTDGLRSPGMEINWLVPRIPFYLLLAVSAFSVAAAAPDNTLASFGGGNRWDLTYVASAHSFFPLTDETSLLVGLNFASGNTSQSQSQPAAATGAPACLSPFASGTVSTACDNFSDFLYGADVYFKWRPLNTARTFAAITWQTEYFMRHIPALRINGVEHRQIEGGMYSQVVAQVARRWYLGVRGELLGVPFGDFIHREYAAAGSITWALSEFARIRLYGEARFPQNADANGAAFLQVEAAIGAHGAHPF